MANKVIMGAESREKIKDGVNELAGAVACTLGAKGRNVLIEQGNGYSPHITKDGVTVARSIIFEDVVKDMGASLIKEAANNTANDAGDGPQPLSSLILTPTGWVKMGDVKIGMDICGTNGTTQKVLGVFYKGVKEVIEVEIANKGIAECCEDHLWNVVTLDNKQITITTKKIMYASNYEEIFTPQVVVEHKNKLIKLTSENITRIERTGRFEEMQCIKVSNDDNLYITNNFIVTHNTSTSVILTQQIFNRGIDAISRGVNIIEMKKGMDKAVSHTIERLKELSKAIESTEQLKNIAYISANNDEYLGNIISEVVGSVGKDGSITVEKSKDTNTTFEIVNGFKIDSGYKNALEFVNNPKRMRVEFDNPLIVMYDRTITDTKPNMDILKLLIDKKQPIVFICEDCDGEFASFLRHNSYKNKMPVCYMQAPNYGQLRHQIMQDVATFTGGKYITLDKGLDLNKCTIEDIGTCQKIIIEKGNTIFIGGAGEQEDINSHINILNEQIEITDDKQAKLDLKDRVAKLKSESAILKVGAVSETELKEKLDRVDDAICACKASMDEGYIAGGGTTFLIISDELNHLKTNSLDEKIGIEIIQKSLEAPFRQILLNAGLEPADFISKIRKMKYGNGYNVKSDKIENLFSTGVIDPTKVARVALDNANSIASTLITTECVLTYETPKQEQNA